MGLAMVSVIAMAIKHMLTTTWWYHAMIEMVNVTQIGNTDGEGVGNSDGECIVIALMVAVVVMMMEVVILPSICCGDNACFIVGS